MATIEAFARIDDLWQTFSRGYMGAEYDVFVSYARIDNESRSGDEGRVTELVDDLTRALATRMGRKSKIAFDQGFAPSEEFNDAIRARIIDSAVMISLISPSYLNSKFGHDEIKWFLDKAAREPSGVKVNHRRRIVNVLLFDVPHDKWFSELSGANFHQFFRREEFGAARPLRRAHGTPYDQSVDVLAEDLAGILEEMGQVSVRSDEDDAPTEGRDRGLMVYVARAPLDEVLRLQRVTNELRRSLVDLPVKVVSWEDYKGQPAGRDRWTEGTIKDAIVTVHLLSALDHSGVREHLRLALQSKARQIIWTGFKAGISSSPNPYFDAISSYRRVRASAAADKIDEMTTAPSEAASTIVARVRGWVEAAIGVKGITVCVDLSPADRLDADADALFEYLKACGINPLGSTADPDDFDSQIPFSKGVLVFYGNVQQDWVASSFNGALRIVTSKDLEQRPGCWGVYYGRPRDDDKPKRSWTRKLQVPLAVLEMDGMDGFRPTVVAPLLERLGVVPPKES